MLSGSWMESESETIKLEGWDFYFLQGFVTWNKDLITTANTISVVTFKYRFY